MKVAIYARVSTIDQHPENQLMVLKEYVQRQKDWELFDIYTDKTSGAKQSRTNLNRLMQDTRRGLIDVVVIWKIDRLGRSSQHMFQIVEEWKKKGIELVITTLGIDTSTPSGKLIFGIMAQIAEFERELTRERTLLAIERRRKDGKPIGRPKGSKDSAKVKRNKSSYYQGWLKRKGKLNKEPPQNRGVNPV